MTQIGDGAGDVSNALGFSDMTSPLVQALSAYWQQIRGHHDLPAKADLDPAQIRKLLPYLTIEELHRDPLRVRFRLVGTEQARFAAMDYTGYWLHELPWRPDVIVDLLGNYRRLIAAHAPIFGAARYAWNDGYVKTFEWALFPLSTDGRTIDHIVGVEDFSMIDRDRLMRLLERREAERRHARPMAGNRGELVQY